MRFLDKWVGGTFCFLVAIVWFVKRLIKSRAAADFPPEKIKNILVIKFFGTGSLYLAKPMFSGIRKRFTNARIYILTFESNREFLEIMDCVDVILPVRKDSMKHFMVDLIKHWWRMLFNRPDLAFDMEFFSYFSVLIGMLFLARIRVGLFAENARRGDLMTVRVGFNHYRHISEVFFQLSQSVGAENAPELFDVNLPSMTEAFESVRSRLRLNDRQRFIVVNIGSSNLFLNRRWPLEYFERFIRWFRREHPEIKVILVGGQGESDYVAGLYAGLSDDDEVVNIAGQTNMREFLSVLEHAAVLVSNDSGPVHFAAGYKTPTVVMFGPETPVVYRPLNPNAIVLYAGLYCSPCMNIYANKDFRGCRDNKCMKNITVEQVVEAAGRLLDGCKVT